MRAWLTGTLRDEPWRTVLGIGAVAAALTLVLAFEGFRAGLYEQARALPETWDVELVAVQPGVENVLAARSVLPQSARRDVEAVPGVVAAQPLGGIPTIYKDGDASTPVYVIAYDTAGGPGRLVAGRPIREAGEIVVDRALAALHHLRPGNEVAFLGYTFRVAGVAGGPTNAFNPYVFVRSIDLVDLYLAGEFSDDVEIDGLLGLLLIEIEPGAVSDEVRAEIERRVPAVDVWTPAELGAHDVRVVDDFMGSAMSLLVGVARIAGVLVVGLTLYASVTARERDFAVVRALGGRRATIALQIAAESGALAAVAFVVALGFAWGIAASVETLAPRYAVAPFTAPALARTALAGLVMAAAGALVGMRRALLVDPMIVFKR